MIALKNTLFSQRKLRAFFGLNDHLINFIVDNTNVEEEDLLLTLFFLKVYPTTDILETVTGRTYKTCMKKVNSCIELLNAQLSQVFFLKKKSFI